MSRAVARNSAIYSGDVFHRRVAPKNHSFRYGVYGLLLDLEELPWLDAHIAGFRLNRFAPISFHYRDHGHRDGSDLKFWCTQTLDRHGINLTSPIYHVMCMPRILGYTFNPISVWFCYQAGAAPGSKALSAIIYEVHNTFGANHSYVVDLRTHSSAGFDLGENAADQRLEHARAKHLHVSPFFDTSGGYNFRLQPPGNKYHLNIRYYDDTQSLRMVADHQARRMTLDSQTLWSMFWRKPLVTAKVVAGIHWEAIQLFTRKSATYYAPSAPPTASSADLFQSRQQQ